MDHHHSVSSVSAQDHQHNAIMTKDNNNKLRSFSTLNTLYHESRQEGEALSREVRQRDAAIADLRARLARYERTSITTSSTTVDHLDLLQEDKENQLGDGCSSPASSVLLGPSRSLLESLCKEICKLKQRRNEAEVRATRLAESSQQEIQRLRVQLADRERELEAVRCQPDHHKDQEIQRLGRLLEERERVGATRAVLCSSLAEEAHSLRRQLDQTVRVCQELLGRLQGNKDHRTTSQEEEMPGQHESKEMTESPDTVANAQILQLQQENHQLKQRVVYVEGLNSKWQKYDSSREEYVRGLCQRLKESGGLSPPSGGPQGPVVRPVLGGSALLHQEIARLNGLLEDKMREATRMGRDAEDLRRRDQELIQTLEQQVLIYTEDFKSERADRERAQGRVNDLKEEISRLQQQLHKQGAGGGRDSRDTAPVCRVHIGHRISSRRHNKESTEQFQRSAAEPPLRRQGGASSSSAAQRPLAALTAATAAAVPPTPSPNWTECRGGGGLSDLQCPRCLTTFDENDAAEYLNHCEECAKL